MRTSKSAHVQARCPEYEWIEFRTHVHTSVCFDTYVYTHTGAPPRVPVGVYPYAPSYIYLHAIHTHALIHSYIHLHDLHPQVRRPKCR